MNKPNATVLCMTCGETKEYHHTPTKRARQVCSRECQWQSMRRWNGRDCEHCGKPITRPSQSKDSGKYCSRECAYAHKTEQQKRCTICGSYLNKKAKDNKLDTCWDCRQILRLMREPKPKPVRLCECGNELRRYARLCDSCKASRPKPKPKSRASDGCHNHRGRHHTRRTGARYEPVNKRKVFERDGYKCYLCGCDVHEWRGKLDDDLATLDHVTPLSMGGDHTYANIKTACWVCNVLKSDQMPADVA